MNDRSDAVISTNLLNFEDIDAVLLVSQGESQEFARSLSGGNVRSCLAHQVLSSNRLRSSRLSAINVCTARATLRAPQWHSEFVTRDVRTRAAQTAAVMPLPPHWRPPVQGPRRRESTPLGHRP